MKTVYLQSDIRLSFTIIIHLRVPSEKNVVKKKMKGAYNAKQSYRLFDSFPIPFEAIEKR